MNKQKDRQAILVICALLFTAFAAWAIKGSYRNQANRLYEKETERMEAGMKSTRENLQYAYPQRR